MAGNQERTERGTPIEGFNVGILCLDTIHPLVPGNVQNATSFDFPVVYQVVDGVSPSVLMAGDESALSPIIQAAIRLERLGVNVIVGACGSFANFQKEITRAVQVPVFLSILSEVPFLLGAIPARQKLGILFSSTSTFTSRIMDQCGILDRERIIAIGVDSLPAFRPILAQEHTLHDDALREQIRQLVTASLKAHPEIGAWLLQCSDLPPYAAAIQSATGLPVFDTCTLIEHLYRACNRSGYGAFR